MGQTLMKSHVLHLKKHKNRHFFRYSTNRRQFNWDAIERFRNSLKSVSHSDIKSRISSEGKTISLHFIELVFSCGYVLQSESMKMRWVLQTAGDRPVKTAFGGHTFASVCILSQETCETTGQTFTSIQSMFCQSIRVLRYTLQYVSLLLNCRMSGEIWVISEWIHGFLAVDSLFLSTSGDNSGSDYII